MFSKIAKDALIAGTVAACLVLTGCETPAGKVTTLAGDTSHLAAGTTYAFAPVADPGAADPRVSNTIVDDRLKTSISNALAAKGYRQTDASQAQVLVTYHIGLKERTDYQIDTMGPVGGGVACGRRGCIGGYGWGAYGAPTDVTAVNYTEGTLMVDLVNTSTGKLAWRGVSQKTVTAKDVDPTKLDAIMIDLTKDLPGNVTTK